MDSPFGLATRFLLRFLMPGALLAAAFGPLILEVCSLTNLKADQLLIMGFSVLVFGWLILLLDMPIHMAFMGRRYWPRWLRNLCVAGEQKRLERYVLRKNLANASGDRATALEYNTRASRFPQAPSGDYEAWYPTRFGNLLASYEQYPSLKYGIDGTFFWYRIWVSIDQDLREEVDNAQALVDGALYATVSLFVCSTMCLVYGLCAQFHYKIEMLKGISAVTFYTGSVVLWLASVVLYRTCLHAKCQYGELFKALFDQHRRKIDFQDILDELDRHIPDLNISGQSSREKNRAAWRFLRWHRYRPRGMTSNRNVSNW